MEDPFEHLRLLREARKGDRQDLQEIMDAHVGTATATVLMFNQQQLVTRMLDADMNTMVDLPDGEQPVAAGDINPTEPATGESS